MINEGEWSVMFREMRRKKQQLTEAECIEILKNEPRGVVSMIGDDGYPYGIPMSHWYSEESGKIYFHGGRRGHKVDALRRCDKVSFCVYDKGYRREGEWALNIKCVLIFGRMRIVEDSDEIADIAKSLSLKFTNDIDYIEEEIRTHIKGAYCFELTPEHITGKLVNES